MNESESIITVARSLPDHRLLGYSCSGCKWELNHPYQLWEALIIYNRHVDTHSPDIYYNCEMMQKYSKYPSPPELPEINYTYRGHLWEVVRENHE
jgi:hypothetical protein